jgi:hypothetical protein
MTGAPVEPGTVVAFSETDVLNTFDGSGTLQGVVDEYLPAVRADGTGGVQDKDVCWVVVSGPVGIATAATFAPGDYVADDGSVGDATTGVGVAISADADGFVRTLVGTISEHAIN